MSGKEKIAENIQKAKSELEQALNELVKMPAFDPGEISYSAHALNNYLMVTGCTAELLIHSLGDHPDSQIRAWIDNLGHVTNLMHHIVRHLMSSSESKDVELRFSKWDLPQLVRRGCNFYKRIAERKNISIVSG